MEVFFPVSGKENHEYCHFLVIYRILSFFDFCLNLIFSIKDYHASFSQWPVAASRVFVWGGKGLSRFLSGV